MPLSKLFLTLMAGSLLMPSLVFAEGDHQSTTGTHSESPEPEASETPRVAPTQFCTRFGEAVGHVSDDTTTGFNKLNTDFSGRRGKVDSDFAGAKATLEQSRQKTDQTLDGKLGDLDAKATTDTQKAAVIAFKAAVKTAVTNRRTAVDAANETFHQAVVAAVAARQGGLRTAATTYKAAVAAAIAHAQASCKAGAATDTVRSQLKTSLAAARAALETARQTAEKVGPNLDAAKAARKAAINAANAAFKAAMAQAVSTLKAALGTAQASESPVPSPAH